MEGWHVELIVEDILPIGPIHLLITHVIMPGSDGREVAEQVAQRHPKVRVLFVSGYTDDAFVRHGVLREGVNFLQKPFSPAVSTCTDSWCRGTRGTISIPTIPRPGYLGEMGITSNNWTGGCRPGSTAW